MSDVEVIVDCPHCGGRQRVNEPIPDEGLACGCSFCKRTFLVSLPAPGEPDVFNAVTRPAYAPETEERRGLIPPMKGPTESLGGRRKGS